MGSFESSLSLLTDEHTYTGVLHSRLPAKTHIPPKRLHGLRRQLAEKKDAIGKQRNSTRMATRLETTKRTDTKRRLRWKWSGGV